MKTLTSILAAAALTLGLASGANAQVNGWGRTPCVGNAVTNCYTSSGWYGASGGIHSFAPGSNGGMNRVGRGGRGFGGGRGGYGGGYGGGFGGGYGGGFGGGYGGFGGYGLAGYGAYGAFGGLLPALGGQVCLDPLSGQPVLCPVLPFWGYTGGWGYGRGHHHH